MLTLCCCKVVLAELFRGGGGAGTFTLGFGRAPRSGASSVKNSDVNHEDSFLSSVRIRKKASSKQMLSPTCDQAFGRCIFGIDEVGLGPLAGPLVVVCCALDLENTPLIPVQDSKKLSEAQREKIFSEILKYKNESIFWGCASISAPDLDRLGIPGALKYGVNTAIKRCLPPFKPDHIIIDGNRKYELPYPSTSVIKADSKHYTVAMASVIAKVLRDRWMCKLGKLYPEFGFEQHKGYGTKKHLTAIHEGHISPHHRYSYAPLRNLIE